MLELTPKSSAKNLGLVVAGKSLKFQSKDVVRIQRLLDPIILTLLFLRLEEPSHWVSGAEWMPRFWGLVVLFATFILPSAGIYKSYRQRSLLTLSRRIISRWALFMILMFMFAQLSNIPDSLQRIATSPWALISLSWLLVTHVLFRKILRIYRLNGGDQRSIVYWGHPDAATKFAKQIVANPWMGFKIIAWFSPLATKVDQKHPNLPLCGGSIREFRDWLNTNKVDRIIFSHVEDQGIKMDQLLSLFGDTSTPVIYAPSWAQSNMRFTVDCIAQQPYIDLWGGERSILDRQTKRSFDIFVSSLLLILLSPLFVVLAIAVRVTSPGPIFFKQLRYGLDGKEFECLKFRTMYIQNSHDDTSVKQATINDPRVTPLGRFLRRWSMDELPQLINVLIGNMSLVGPRPHAVQHNEYYRRVIPGYMQRHSFKPGITGLAQIMGFRGETRAVEDMEKRIHADLAYQRDWSFVLDLKILFKTIVNINNNNAY